VCIDIGKFNYQIWHRIKSCLNFVISFYVGMGLFIRNPYITSPNPEVLRTPFRKVLSQHTSVITEETPLPNIKLELQLIHCNVRWYVSLAESKNMYFEWPHEPVWILLRIWNVLVWNFGPKIWCFTINIHSWLHSPHSDGVIVNHSKLWLLFCTLFSVHRSVILLYVAK
jgi:hypothetical protein